MLLNNKNMIILDSLEFHNVIKKAVHTSLLEIKLLPQHKEVNSTFLNTEQLAQKLQVSDQTINRWRKKNRIPFVKIGKSFRYDVEEVLQVLSTKKVGK